MEQQEWIQLMEMRQSLNDNLMAYDPYAQEKFAELFVKSLEGKGDPPVRTVSRTP